MRTYLARRSGKSCQKEGTGWESEGSKITGKCVLRRAGGGVWVEREVTLVDVNSHHLPGVSDSPPRTHSERNTHSGPKLPSCRPPMLIAQQNVTVISCDLKNVGGAI